MANTAYITITSAGQQLTFTPADLKITYESLAGEDSGRTDDGVMHIDWKLRKIPKLDITLPPHAITDANYNRILSYVQGQVYTINYYDYIAGQRKSIDVYTSSTALNWYSGVVLDGTVTGESFTAIAMEGEANIPHGTQLSTPIISRSVNTVSWGAVTHATSYTVDLDGTITTQTTRTKTIDLTSSHLIKVKATATGYIDSEWAVLSYTPEAQQLATPVVSRSGNNFVWQAVPNATQYKIIIESETHPVNATITATSYAIPDLATSYYVNVQAQAPNTVYTNSEWCNFYFRPNVTIETAASPVGGGTTAPDTQVVPQHTMVTVSATPASGYTFTGWYVQGVLESTDEDYTFEAINNRTGNRTVTAHFEASVGPQLDEPENADVDTMGAMYWDSVTNATQYRLQIQSPVPDEQVVTTTYYALTDIEHSYDIKIRAEATGYTPSDWVTVHFSPVEQYYIATQADPVAGGTTLGDGYYNEGATATLTATPALGYLFDHWEDDGGTDIGSTPTITVTVGGSITYTAVFRFTGVCHISYGWNHAGATDEIDGPEYATIGDQITVSTEAKAGYYFNYWWEWDECEDPLSEDNPWTLTVPDLEEYEINAYFELC